MERLTAKEIINNPRHLVNIHSTAYKIQQI